METEKVLRIVVIVSLSKNLNMKKWIKRKLFWVFQDQPVT